MNLIERGFRTFDRFHERHRWLAFPYAVIKKFGDDQAGGLAAQMAYYGFLALFPLLMVLTTILGLVARHNPTLQAKIVGSALAQFPIIGTQIRQNVHSLPRSGLALALGLVGAIYGSLGAIRVAETAMNTIWDVPRKRWPNFVFSLARAAILLVVVGALTLAASVSSGLAAGASLSIATRLLGIVISLGLNLALFYGVFAVLTRRRVTWRELWPGVLIAAAAWTVLQSIGGLYISHTLRNSTELYGFFGVVIALLVWIYLGAEITLYAAEINVVRAKRLWPRRIVQPPLSRADERAMRAYASREERRPEEHLEVKFDHDR
jgi:YihY family inner membrane protein